jgi:hypothetical protein
LELLRRPGAGRVSQQEPMSHFLENDIEYAPSEELIISATKGSGGAGGVAGR